MREDSDVWKGQVTALNNCVRARACVCLCVYVSVCVLCTTCGTVSPFSATGCTGKARQQTQWTRRKELDPCHNPGSSGALGGGDV